MTISWPTSLDNATVTGTTERRSTIDADKSVDSGETSFAPDLYSDGVLENDHLFTERAKSTSENSGNTTFPPSLFGVIPLGNSFNITVTYDKKSKYASSLPASSVSDDPTTWTRHGVTYLNWTIPMAKGTRFILVAGMSKDEQWASGGSSMLYTVGQGDSSCSDGTSPAPSVTATTDEDAPTSGSGSGNGDKGGSHHGGNDSGTLRTALASVFSVLGTLVVVGAIWLCCRSRRKRRSAKNPTGKTKEGFASAASLSKQGAGGETDAPHEGQYRMDLLDNGTATRSDTDTAVRTLDYDHPHSSQGNTMTSSPTEYHSMSGGPGSYPIQHSPVDFAGSTGSRGTSSRQQSSRAMSTDPLLSGDLSSPSSSANHSWVPLPLGSMPSSAHRSLVLHNGDATNSSTLSEGQEDDGDMPDLKRETLAMSGPGSSMQSSPTTTGVSAAAPRARRRRDEELEYLVHRDAGRVYRPTREERRVLELPPRYEELNWEQEQAAEPARTEEVDGNDELASPLPVQSTAGSLDTPAALLDGDTHHTHRSTSPAQPSSPTTTHP